MANDHGEGHGGGDGYGDGCGHGEGYGGGGGSGGGYVGGYGYGGVCGFGFGYGGDSGFGYGGGDGSGYGHDGSGLVIGRVGKYEVVHLALWPYVRVGCEQHAIAYWRANWQKIAREHAVFLDCDFDALLDSAEGRQNGA